MAIQNDNVVYNMNVFPTIKPRLMCLLPSFLNLDQYPISKPNTNRQLLQSHNPRQLFPPMWAKGFHAQVHGYNMM